MRIGGSEFDERKRHSWIDFMPVLRLFR